MAMISFALDQTASMGSGTRWLNAPTRHRCKVATLLSVSVLPRRQADPFRAGLHKRMRADCRNP